MKKLSVFAILAVLIMTLTAFVCSAQVYEYYPDADGLYTVTFDGKADNEYIIIVLKGIFDETNYVEAYNKAPDSDIMYYEQLASLPDGKVTFGPFAPMAYFDSTVIIGGTDLAQPVLAGYVKSAGISNVAGIEINGVENAYTVKGLDGQDIVIDVDAVLMDAYGYPAITDEKAIVSVEGLDGYVSVDSFEGVVTVDKCAKAGTLTITASCGDYSESIDVEIKREEAKAHSVKAYLNEQKKVPVTSCTTDLVDGESVVMLMLYSETYDQYGEIFEDTRKGYVGETQSAFETTYLFNAVGNYIVKIVSDSNENAYAKVNVTVQARPAYTDNSLELYMLIKDSKDELALVGTEKFISTQNGKDIYPEDVWTTEAKKVAFESAVASAETALAKFNVGEIEDAALASYVTSLTSAKNTYVKSFKQGVRVDITALEITKQNIRLPLSEAKVALEMTVTPAVNTDKITYRSSDPETVFIDENGNMVAKENGTVTITATTSTGLTAYTTVTAYKKAVRLQLAESSVNLTFGDEPYLLKVEASPADQSEILTWTSSRPDIATVDSNGLITAQRKAGTAKILVQGEHGLAASCEVRVALPAWETVSAPVASVVSGSVFKGTTVELTTATEGAKIYYTLDGSEPTVMSRPYAQPIVVNSNMTVKAFAVADKMFDSSVVSYDYTVVTPEISVGDARIAKGYSGEIEVTLKNNPGIKNLSIVVKSDVLKPVKVQAGEALASLDFEYNLEDEEGLVITWNGDESDTSEGVIAIITFDSEDCDSGYEYKVEAEVRAVQDSEAEAFDVETSDGFVKIVSAVVGDVNSDEAIDLKDVLILAQYCAEWPEAQESAMVEAADCNGDGSVDIRDVILLAQYCAGWDVTLG